MEGREEMGEEGEHQRLGERYKGEEEDLDKWGCWDGMLGG